MSVRAQGIRSLSAAVLSVLIVGSVVTFGTQPDQTAAVPMASSTQASIPYTMSTAQPALPSVPREYENLPPLVGDGAPADGEPGAALGAAAPAVVEEPPGEDTTVLRRPTSVPTVAVESVKPDRGTLLAMPLDGRRTSRFGMRFHPIRKVWKLHSGLDLAAPCGAPVGAAAAGTVVRTGWAGGNGIQVKIDHGRLGGRNVVTTYNHLSAIGVRVGQSVQAHQGVGRVGNTGYSTGCHLHFEVIANGSFTDPEPWLSGTAVDVDTAGMTAALPTSAGEVTASTPATVASTPTPTPSATSSPTPSAMLSPTPSATPSPEGSPVSSPSHTATPTPSTTPSVSATPTVTPTPCPSPEDPKAPQPCPTVTPSGAPTASETPSSPAPGEEPTNPGESSSPPPPAATPTPLPSSTPPVPVPPSTTTPASSSPAPDTPSVTQTATRTATQPPPSTTASAQPTGGESTPEV